jgi:hypothetical protein
MGKALTICVGVIAFCKVFEVLIALIKYAKDYGDDDEDSDEPVPQGMYA